MKRIAVPAYFIPQAGGSVAEWAPMVAQAPTAEIAVFNINLDRLDPLSLTPSDFYDKTGWRNIAPSLVQQAQQAGMLVLGYVPTDGGTSCPDPSTGNVNSWPTLDGKAKKDFRSEPHVNKYVDLWYGFPGLQIDGIFFDEGPQPWRFTGPAPIPAGQYVNDAIKLFYQRICSHVKNKQNVRGTKVSLNASEFQGEWVMKQPLVADIVNLYEGTAEKYMSSASPPTGYDVQPWIGSYPGRASNVVYACTDTPSINRVDRMRQIVSKSCARGFMYGYVLDYNTHEAQPGGQPNEERGFRHLGSFSSSTFWLEEVQAVKTTCPPTPIDTQAPATTCTTSPVPNAVGWNNSNVTVRLHATDNPGGTGVDHITYSVNGVPQPPVPGDTATFQVATEGQTLITFAATDKATPNPNTETPEKSCTVRLDKTAPTVTVAVPADGATYTLNQQVNASYSCSDMGGSGPPKSCNGTVPIGSPIDTSTYGTKTFTVTAEDNAGNKTTTTVTYNVFFNFSGFFPPVDNWPKLNKRNAGANVPVKFSLGGNQGLDIFAQGYPKSQEIPCNNPSVEVAGTTPTSSPGGSGLTYDAGSDQYHYNWKTEKGWEGTCRQLVVKLKDGSFHRANFQFT